MKMLSLLILCALLVLSQAAAFPETMDEAASDKTHPEDPSKEPETKDIPKVLLEEGTGNETDAEEPIFEPLDEETYMKALNGTVLRSGSCSPGWTWLKGRCYHVFPILSSWYRAQSNCRSIKAHLASVHDFEVNYQLLRLISAAGQGRRQVWIGGSDLHRERRWYWVDGTQFRYRNWCRGEPNNFAFNQHCLQMNYSWSRCWDDEFCDNQKPFICARNY